MPFNVDLVVRRLRKCITDSGYTYEQLEKMTGISRSTLQRYANGVTAKIPIDAVQAVAKALGVRAEYILGWDEDNPEEDELNEYLEQLKNRSEMRMLFKLTKSATKEDVMKAVKIIEALKGESEDE